MIFKWVHPFSTEYYLVNNFSGNVELSESKFEWVVFELFNFVYQ